MLTQIQLMNEIRDIHDEGHVEIIDGDGISSTFVLKKRPYLLDVKFIPSCIEPSCTNPKHFHDEYSLKRDEQYSIDYKSHKIIFKKIPEILRKIRIEWKSPKNVTDETFLSLPGNDDILESVKKYFNIDPEIFQRYSEFKWHQIVRLATNTDTARYMYEKFLSLLLKHRRHYKDYFQLETEEGTFYEPNFLSRINKIFNLGNLLFEIYSNILKKTNFEYPRKNLHSQIIRGSINWEKTIKNSKNLIPVDFHSTIPFRKFDTPENFLIILCLNWLYSESKNILEKNPSELNDSYLKNSLLQICNKSEILLKKFPFPKTFENSKHLWSLEITDLRINQLIMQTKFRLKKGLIKNKDYGRMLTWIELFKELDLSFASQENTTNYPLSSIKNYDTVFEAWVFFTFYDYLKRKQFRPFLKISPNSKKDGYNAYFEFFVRDHVIKFYYEKKYNAKNNNIWFANSTPDFSIEYDDKIICILDAKNFQKDSKDTYERNSNQLKMLGYMMNSNSKLGGLIFPYYPEKLESMSNNNDLKRSLIRNFVSENNPLLDERKNQKQFNSLVEKIRNNIPDELNSKAILKERNSPNNSYFKGSTYLDIRLEPSKNSEYLNDYVLEKLLKIIIEQLKN